MFDIGSDKLRGLKLATIGILMGASGFGIAFLGAREIGVLIGWAGGVTVLAGLLWNSLLMFQNPKSKDR